MDKMREALEKARENILRVQAWEDHTDPDPQSNWHCYQRAIEAVDAALSSERQESGEADREAIIEECARVVEGERRVGDWNHSSHNVAIAQAANAVRTLANRNPATPPQESGERKGLEFKQQIGGARVATLLENDTNIIEVLDCKDGTYDLVIHLYNEERGLWDDLTAYNVKGEVLARLGSLAPSLNSGGENG